MKLSVQGNEHGVEVSDEVFAREFNESLVHQAVVAYMAGGRAGTRAHKSRSEVRGGGAKPWKQKGTGRARAGTSRSPIWRSGGKTFAAKPQNYQQKMNRKMYRAAMRAIFSELARQDRLVLVDQLSVDAPRTKALLEQLSQLSLRDVLIVTHEADANLYLSARNLHTVDVTEVSDLDPVSLVHFEKILMTVPAVKQVEEWLG
ncbi:50S ribosomal protein L4 [Thiorhodospira sibirica]|uniref:50S ribosomal protein L4 n=1 Tax=Thiorhodospira sibirica TaxID=154347 RepID=UPI00022C3A2A|nr:50S ribosomal protein L4 [Thiorhodospira sibirica]